MKAATFAGTSWLFVSCVKLLLTSGLLFRRTDVFPRSMSPTAFVRTLIALSRSASSSSTTPPPPLRPVWSPRYFSHPVLLP
ncbi:hypothetical protein DPMN_047034 [Dreissena polymorpha]|uniref:Uncharacterized protein n=1 Tax=Dreissena polymorpha TaxID=45954 RepID=A0A9D4D8T7_DREPO|nr:hypothetical protein DPMN_047034 [Dreissena polymorpha]